MSVTEPVGVAMVGVGGHAVTHLTALEALQRQGLARLVAVTEAAPQRWTQELDGLRSCGVAVEPDLDHLLERHRREVSVVGVPVGIPGHRPVSVAALKAGYHVVLEKPPAGSIDDYLAMLDAQRASERVCAVHFQWIWLRSLRQVKEAILTGRIGSLREVRVKGRWFRADPYYARNAWAGRLRAGDTWVLDGTINNPFAHQVNNGLWLAGREMDAWAQLVRVRAELYHARPHITGDDTTCLTVETDTGPTLRFWFTLCSDQPQRHPTICVIGERGRIVWPLDDGSGQIRPEGGAVETIEPDRTPGSQAVYANVCRHLLGRDPRVLCTLADTRPFVATISAAYEVAGPPCGVDVRHVARKGEGDKAGYVLKGIDEAIERGFELGAMFSEIGLDWAVPARQCEVGETYRHFAPTWPAE